MKRAVTQSTQYNQGANDERTAILAYLRQFQTLNQFWTSKRRCGSRISLTEGRGRIVDPEGHILWQEPCWMPNALADEGEANVLDVWLREQAHLAKYLALLTTAPTEAMTVITMNELFTPPLNGYARQSIVSSDWSAPVLVDGDYQVSAAEKTFGPATAAWSGITHVALVSSATPFVGKFLAFVSLASAVSLAVGQSYKYTMRIRAL